MVITIVITTINPSEIVVMFTNFLRYPTTAPKYVYCWRWDFSPSSWDFRSRSTWRLGNSTVGYVLYKVVPPQDSVQLVNITPISLWFLLVIYQTSFHGVYKPRNITFEGHHLVDVLVSTKIVCSELWPWHAMFFHWWYLYGMRYSGKKWGDLLVLVTVIYRPKTVTPMLGTP